MKKYIYFPISLLLIVASCQSDDTSDNVDSVSGKTIKSYFENDIMSDRPNIRTSRLSSEEIKAINNFSSLINNLDTDKDGLSDYAEERITGLKKDNPNDVKLLTAIDTIEIRKDDGTKISIPFYKTSYYQNNFCNPAAPTFRTDQLSDREIGLLEDTYYKTLKVIRTPEFQNYILMKPAGKELGQVFLEKARDLKRGVQFNSLPEYQGNVGVSNRWSYIHISHWAMSPGYTNYLDGVPHEFIHHIGYGHEYDYAYGGGYMMHNMFNQSKFDYEITDLEQKKLYKGYPTQSKWSNINGYVVLHYAKITDNSSNYIINEWNWTTDAINSNQNLDFTKNFIYNLNICTLNAQKVSIWVDFNDDAEYTNDERILIDGFCSGGWAITNLSFSIPSFAKVGKHYMRINSGFYYTSPSAYGPNLYGSSFNLYNVTIK